MRVRVPLGFVDRELRPYVRPAEHQAVADELAQVRSALDWALSWIEQVSEAPIPGEEHGEQQDWERWEAAHELVRKGA